MVARNDVVREVLGWFDKYLGQCNDGLIEVVSPPSRRSGGRELHFRYMRSPTHHRRHPPSRPVRWAACMYLPSAGVQERVKIVAFGSDSARRTITFRHVKPYQVGVLRHLARAFPDLPRTFSPGVSANAALGPHRSPAQAVSTDTAAKPGFNPLDSSIAPSAMT
jgi:hypothetical protein